eukprot:gene16369-19477_t
MTKQMLDKAPPFLEVQKKVATIIKDKIIIGHDIKSDLKVLMLSHSIQLWRDASRYPPFLVSKVGGDGKSFKKVQELKELAHEHLCATIHNVPRSSEDDALACLGLYQKHKKAWEFHVRKTHYKSSTKPKDNSDDE